jgi:hypothetical protein
MTGYVHWRRFNWSLDSICPNCLATIANAKDEADLAEHERNHVCADRSVARRSVQAFVLGKLTDDGSRSV